MTRRLAMFRVAIPELSGAGDFGLGIPAGAQLGRMMEDAEGLALWAFGDSTRTREERRFRLLFRGAIKPRDGFDFRLIDSALVMGVPCHLIEVVPSDSSQVAG